MVQDNDVPLQSYAPARVRVLLLTALLLATAVIDLAAVASDGSRVASLARAAGGESVAINAAAANDGRQQTVLLAQLAVLVPTAIVFLAWVHRAHQNLTALRVRGMRFSPGMAVGWFFVPVFNLFQPYHAAKEIWRASDPDVNPLHPYDWQNTPAPAFLRGWWLAWIASGLGASAAIVIRSRAAGADLLMAAGGLSLAGNALNALAAVLAVRVVRAIRARQDLKAASLTKEVAPVIVDVVPAPETAGELFRRGVGYYDQNDFEKALADFEAAIRIDPDLIEAYIHRGLVHYYSGDTRRAIASLDGAIARRPADGEVYFLRGKWLADSGQSDRAKSDLNKALQLGLEPPSRMKGVEVLLGKLAAS